MESCDFVVRQHPLLGKQSEEVKIAIVELLMKNREYIKSLQGQIQKSTGAGPAKTEEY